MRAALIPAVLAILMAGPAHSGSPAFHPVSEPDCGLSAPTASDAEVASRARCNLQFVIARAYNSSHGDLGKTMGECVGVMRQVLGPKRNDSTYEFVCAQEASTMNLPAL